jgi:hypothetical protein
VDRASPVASGLTGVPDRPKPSEILVEFVAIGNSVKVTAVDPATGLEAIIVGPAGAARNALADAARRKLEFLKSKKA